MSKQISKILKVGMRTIDRLKKRLLKEGLEGVLDSRAYDRKIDGDTEAKLAQLCCSDPPAGHAKWSLRLLSEDGEIGICREYLLCFRQKHLKKSELKPWKVRDRVIPPAANNESVAQMVQVLDAYKRAYDVNDPLFV